MKRLFVVFVIVMMLFVVGCQSTSVVKVNIDECSESIFFINDENMINAGISRVENSKYSGNGGYTAESTGSMAFENTLIESIVLNNPKGIKLTAESHAFANCSALTSIVISDRKSTLMLAENAFYQVEHITFYISKNSLRNACSSTYTMEKLGTIQAPSFLAP